MTLIHTPVDGGSTVPRLTLVPAVLLAIASQATPVNADALINAVGFSSTDLKGFTVGDTFGGGHSAFGNGSLPVNGQSVPAVTFVAAPTTAGVSLAGITFTQSFTVSNAEQVIGTFVYSASRSSQAETFVEVFVTSGSTGGLNRGSPTLFDFDTNGEVIDTFTAGLSAGINTVELVFESGSSQPASFALAELSLSVPEPGPLGLAFAGIASVAVAGRRRRGRG